MSTPGGVRGREDVLRACEETADADQLFDRVSHRLRKLVSYDGSTWFGTDPATLLATAPVRIENVEQGHCESFWQREFLVGDSNLFVDLVRSDRTVATLYGTTGAQPARSARHREFLAPQGYDDELRLLLRIGQSTWGLVSLYREHGRAPFSDAEARLVGSLSQPLATALRACLRGRRPDVAGVPVAPGMLVFDACGQLLSSNVEAQQWIDRLPTDVITRQTGLPVPVHTVVWQARAVAEGREPGPARARLLTRDGRWLQLHGSTLSDGLIAVVVEEARSSDIAPIIVDVYDLSPREEQITQLLARGLNTTQIAQELHLSAHTVRDYVKAVFDKVGVRSRGELVASLFANHAAPQLHEAAVHAQV